MGWTRARVFGGRRFALVGLVLVCLAATGLVSAGEVAQATAATATTGGYPFASVPCVWSPYSTSGKANTNWCKEENTKGKIISEYDWGTIPKNNTSASELSPYKYDYRNCTDFVAWKLSTLGVKPAQYVGLGDAKSWVSPPASAKLVVNSTPTPGSVAVDPNGEYGHVAFVQAVNPAGYPAGTIEVTQYNQGQDGNYSVQYSTPAELSFTKFVHFEQYETTGPGYSPPPTPTLCSASNVDINNANCPDTIEADVNGDGLTDLVKIGPPGIDTFLSTGWGGYTLAATNQKPTNFPNYSMSGCFQWVVGDFDSTNVNPTTGIARTDLACIWSGGVDIWLSNGDGTYRFNGTDYPGNNYNMTGCIKWVTGQFSSANSDTDLACIYSGGVGTWFFNPGGGFSVYTYAAPAGYGMTGCNWLVGKFRPGGITDLACEWGVSTSGGIDTWFANGDGTFTVAPTYRPTSYNMSGGFYWTVADVTGTGVDSILYFWSGGVDTWMSDSDGTYTVVTQTAPAGYTMQGGDWQFGNFTGGPDADIVNINKNGVDTWKSLGNGHYNVIAESQTPFSGYNMLGGIEFLVGRETATSYDSLLHLWSGGINTWLYNAAQAGSWVMPPTAQTSGYVYTGGTWY